MRKMLVYDVETVKILGMKYKYTSDHSKWGASLNGDVPAVCIGDINRQRNRTMKWRREMNLEAISSETLFPKYFTKISKRT
ncbi:hypothetical protein TELCIR_04644 [Teladorsagia circumcincta]|uniref:Uncharacterized protein n=1 Tax=Teladorsagia circumcincta TaxID=45464 RepID=A0A2G9UT31_TELCI|nr:hypothetical protein TELCIR_04644 [Teladorsagia circumcincta]